MSTFLMVFVIAELCHIIFFYGVDDYFVGMFDCYLRLCLLCKLDDPEFNPLTGFGNFWMHLLSSGLDED